MTNSHRIGTRYRHQTSVGASPSPSTILRKPASGLQVLSCADVLSCENLRGRQMGPYIIIDLQVSGLRPQTLGSKSAKPLHVTAQGRLSGTCRSVSEHERCQSHRRRGLPHIENGARGSRRGHHHRSPCWYRTIIAVHPACIEPSFGKVAPTLVCG